MAIISVCFSGHPRGFLDRRDAWTDYFSLLKKNHQLRIFFHCWSITGTVLRNASGQYVEGHYDTTPFVGFDAMLDFLRPDGFSIESISAHLDKTIATFPAVYMTPNQGSKRAILSQLHSIRESDKMRETYDAIHGSSDVVIKLRFDLHPMHHVENEINFVVANRHVPVLFVPPRLYHAHPGGGGGCVTCHSFFDQHFRNAGFGRQASRFLGTHGTHGNDICDLHAIGSPESMTEYTAALANAAEIYRKILISQLQSGVHETEFCADGENSIDLRAVDGPVPLDIENLPFFYPEKLLRFGLPSHMLVHGESAFAIVRK